MRRDLSKEALFIYLCNEGVQVLQGSEYDHRLTASLTESRWLLNVPSACKEWLGLEFITRVKGS